MNSFNATNDSSTPISNLPDPMTIGANNGIGAGGQFRDNGSANGFGAPGSNNNVYMPMNPHKNPYNDSLSSNPVGFNGMAPTRNTKDDRQNSFGSGGAIGIEDIPEHYTLPARDIPRQMDRFHHDEQIKAGYIPGSKGNDLDDDYIPEEMNKIREKRRQKEKHVRFAEDTIVDIQQPLILALLFFILQLPAVNNIICKYLGSFGFAGIDGNISIAGLFLKSIVFGGFVYGYKWITNDM